MSRYNGNMGLAFDLSLGRQPAMTSSEQTARQIMCSAAAGAAGNSTSDRFTNSNTAARRDAAAAEHDHVHVLNNTIVTSDVGDLETYVRALQCEREKLDAFRRELPICMGLLDDAIEASSVKLIKAVEGSIASRASYMSTRATMNTGSSPYSNSNPQSINKHLGMEDSSVPNTPGRPTSLTGAEHLILNSLWPSNINQHAITSGTSSANWISKLPAGNMQISSPTSSIQGAGTVQLQLMNENFQIAAAPAVTPRWSRAPENQQLVKQQTLIAAPIKKEGIYSLRDDTIRSNMRDDEHVDSCFMSTEELHEIRYKDRGRTTEFMRNNMTAAGSPHNINNMQAQCTSTGHVIGGGGNGSQPPRKVRRCWSPELHQRFLHALHQLGGPQLATPKQIREVMHVDGLTNDEVKSHLQKYRLHTRRPSLLQTCEPAAEQPHHLLLFGGIWVPTGAAGSSAESASKSADELAVAAGALSQSSNATFNMHRFQSQVYTSPNSPTVMSATSSDQLDTQAGVEVASEVDVARSSDQSTSLNGEGGGGGATMGPHSFEEEDTQIHLGSKLL